MNSYDNTAYSVPKNKRNSGNNDALRENQSMGTYIPSSFNGVFLQNVKNAQDTKYDYEIGGDFGPKGKNIPNKIDNSMGQPSQVYGTEELKNSISLSFSGFPNKGNINWFLLLKNYLIIATGTNLSLSINKYTKSNIINSLS